MGVVGAVVVVARSHANGLKVCFFRVTNKHSDVTRQGVGQSWFHEVLLALYVGEGLVDKRSMKQLRWRVFSVQLM